MNLNNIAKLSQHLQLALLIVMALSMTSLFHGKNIPTNSLSQSSQIESNHEFLAKVKSINLISTSNSSLKNNSVMEIELINLKSGENLSTEKMRICTMLGNPSFETPTAFFKAEQAIDILRQAKNNNKLVKIGHPGLWKECIQTVKISELPKGK